MNNTPLVHKISLAGLYRIGAHVALATSPQPRKDRGMRLGFDHLIAFELGFIGALILSLVA